MKYEELFENPFTLFLSSIFAVIVHIFLISFGIVKRIPLFSHHFNHQHRILFLSIILRKYSVRNISSVVKVNLFQESRCFGVARCIFNFLIF